MNQTILAQTASQNSALPDKKYFKIGEASSLLSVKPHVLRYWESEFPQIKPYKSRTGQRLYRRRDVEALQHIQRLLYQERYTIAGARQALRMMYENESPILEEVLSEDAIEAAGRGAASGTVGRAAQDAGRDLAARPAAADF